MSRSYNLPDSLKLLYSITDIAYADSILPEAKSIWTKHLQEANPLWKHVAAKSFSIESESGSAHVMAMLDDRLPGIGMVGFFATTNLECGAEVLNNASDWLNQKRGIKDIYGPINGTITRDYRLNLADDFQIPGEPVNPSWYIDAFKNAGFEVYNRYVSGRANHFNLLTRLIKPVGNSKELAGIKLRAFDVKNQLNDFKKYHELMNAIFPSQSIYCPVLSWEERLYNLDLKDPIFNPYYTFFLEDDSRIIGFIVAYPYNDQLVVKTIGLLPEYRGRRLSSILLKKVHDQASLDGLSAAIYSTVRVGNTAYKMKRPGVKIFRKYVTMKKSY